MTYDIGMIGLAVMGENLTLNIESKGFSVCGYDISKERMDAFQHTRAMNKKIGFATSLEELVSTLQKPRTIMIMIRAGEPVDQVLRNLLPLLDKEDIIIDGGNSNYVDTQRRCITAEKQGIYFIGSGVSGGEEGALNGPSLMPGGSEQAWKHVKPIFEAIAARTKDGSICTDWIGPGGSGHFVKMVHNGIEYGDIQLITEVYHIMRDGLHLSTDEIGDVFERWNQSELNSYLIEITANILHAKDTDGTPLVDKIMDKAGQKGTGKWTVNHALEEGVPLTLIGESVFARFLSSQKEERVKASIQYNKTIGRIDMDKDTFIEQLKDALYVAKILSYAQGFSLMQEASLKYQWNLDFGRIAMIWRAGCIIRSQFLDKIKDAYIQQPALVNLLSDQYFMQTIASRIQNYRLVVSTGVLHGIPMPSLSSGLAYFDGYTTKNLPANLLQAMRDYFGAHTYQRLDKPEEQSFHTDWTGRGGKTSSSTYDA